MDASGLARIVVMVDLRAHCAAGTTVVQLTVAIAIIACALAADAWRPAVDHIATTQAARMTCGARKKSTDSKTLDQHSHLPAHLREAPLSRQ